MMNDYELKALLAACLFCAERARRIHLMALKVGHGTLISESDAYHTEAVNNASIIATAQSGYTPDRILFSTLRSYLDAHILELNRQAQIAASRSDTELAELYEGKMQSAYSARTYLVSQGAH